MLKLIQLLSLSLTLQVTMIKAAIDRSPCGRLPRIRNGYASNYSVSIVRSSDSATSDNTSEDDGDQQDARTESATYTCFKGFERVGADRLFCVGKKWTPQVPQCRPVTTPATSTTTIRSTTKQSASTTTISAASLSRQAACSRLGLAPTHSMCLSTVSSFVGLEPLNKGDILEFHNNYRRTVSPAAKSMPMLQWDDDLQATAEGWASRCPQEHDRDMSRALPNRKDGKGEWDWVGQNMYWNSGNVSIKAAIDSWGRERQNWQYGMQNPVTVVGHYTQMIAARSLYVGCAKAQCQGRWTYVYICNYGPGGNVDTDGSGQFYAYPYEISASTTRSTTTTNTAKPTAPTLTPRPTRATVIITSTTRTVAPTTTTTTTLRTTTTSSTTRMSQPKRGSQCKYGVRPPHSLCLADSAQLVQLEPVNIQEVLDKHNLHRAAVNPPAAVAMPKLQWDNDLALEAERWAAQCPTDHDSSENRAFPSTAGKSGFDWVGQNLYWYSADANVTMAIDAWADEQKDWYYGVRDPAGVVGHYTQIISARTLFVGCAKSRCQGARWATTIACNYGPGGNFDTDGAGYYAYPYKASRVAAPISSTTRSTQPIPQPRPTTGGLTSPRNGAQCKYGVAATHAFCLQDSSRLVSLEPVSISEVIDRHNYFRARVNPPAKTMPNLQWDSDLAIMAERWAAQCRFEHSTQNQRALAARDGVRVAWPWVGENICFSSGFNQTWTQCIDDWASEVTDWQYGVGRTANKPVGHYTQIVWAKTLFVGCGYSKCRDATNQRQVNNYLVCMYGEGGNIGWNGADPYATPYEKASN